MTTAAEHAPAPPGPARRAERAARPGAREPVPGTDRSATTALGAAILLLLRQEPLTGRVLAREFHATLGYLWRVERRPFQQELLGLCHRGYVEPEELARPRGVGDKRFALTASGHAHLRDWAVTPFHAASAREDVLVRLLATDLVDLATLRDDLANRLAFHQHRAKRLQQTIAEHLRTAALDVRHRRRLTGLRLGLHQERGWVAWCEEALEFLPSAGDGVALVAES